MVIVRRGTTSAVGFCSPMDVDRISKTTLGTLLYTRLPGNWMWWCWWWNWRCWRWHKRWWWCCLLELISRIASGTHLCNGWILSDDAWCCSDVVGDLMNDDGNVTHTAWHAWPYLETQLGLQLALVHICTISIELNWKYAPTPTWKNGAYWRWWWWW